MTVLAAPLPLGALITGLTLVAVPVLILVMVWAAVRALRILLPERPLPLVPVERRRPTLRGQFVPVRLRDILEDQAQRRAALPQNEGEKPEASAPVTHPLFDDLWLRRN